MAMNATASEQAERAAYGVSSVSGFYGPGSLTGWCLLSTAVFIQKAFKEESEAEGTLFWNIMMRIDLFVIGMFAYPFIASVDVLAHMGIYVAGSGQVALLDAPLIVLTEARVAFAFVLLACLINAPKKHRNPHITAYFMLGCLFYFNLAHAIAEMRCSGAGWTSYVNTVLPLPYQELIMVPTSCTDNIRRYLTTFLHVSTKPYGFIEEITMDGEVVLAEGIVKLLVFGVSLFTTDLKLPGPCGEKLHPALTQALRSLFCCVAGWAILYKLILQTAITLLLLLAMGGRRRGIPQSDIPFYDLGQLAAFIAGGFLPFLWCVVTATVAHLDKHDMKKRVSRRGHGIWRWTRDRGPGKHRRGALIAP
ncbi:hypothetical protein BX600DRAFT_437693 [Xylariales sp. PMI_506]|nr:hypothetical protein BX600DRAFT_437693 [Xylariales sp. PMI_506]